MVDLVVGDPGSGPRAWSTANMVRATCMPMSAVGAHPESQVGVGCAIQHHLVGLIEHLLVEVGGQPAHHQEVAQLLDPPPSSTSAATVRVSVSLTEVKRRTPRSPAPGGRARRSAAGAGRDGVEVEQGERGERGRVSSPPPMRFHSTPVSSSSPACDRPRSRG